MRRFKNFSSGLISLIIVYFIFCTMNELVAQLIFFFGLSIIGVYIFKLSHLTINKLKDIKLCDCGFWNKDGVYNWDIKLVDFSKEPYTTNKVFNSQANDFNQARIIESLAYNIIGKKDREFLDGLLTFMNSYDL